MSDLVKTIHKVLAIVETAPLKDQRVILSYAVALLYYLENERNADSAKRMIESQFCFYAKNLVDDVAGNPGFTRGNNEITGRREPKPSGLTDKQYETFRSIMNTLRITASTKSQSEVLAWAVAVFHLEVRRRDEDKASIAIEEKFIPLAKSLISDAAQYIEQKAAHYALIESAGAVKN